MPAPGPPEQSGDHLTRTAAPPVDRRAGEIDRLAARWAALAPGNGRASPVLHTRLVTLLHRLAARCREPHRPARARRLGEDLLRSGLCGEPNGPLYPAEDVLAPTLALLREQGPGALGLSAVPRRRLAAVLDELAAGFAAALRDRVHGEHEDLLRTRLAQAATQDVLTGLPNRPVVEQWVHRAFARSGAHDGEPVHTGLCALDLDGFGAVTERLGRDVGDRLLVAESSGAIVPLGRWVLEQACAQAAAWWRERGPDAPYVSVNVSPVELVEPGWAAEAVRVIDLTGVPPEKVQLEITEQALLAEEAVSLTALRTLRDAGIRLALDDFGTGWSGLSWLRRLPVHAIKIDGSFVEGLRPAEPDPVDLSIIVAMVNMAHAIGLEVTAEWVETVRQAERLTALGCDLGQGRWFGDAGPAASVGVSPRRSIDR